MLDLINLHKEELCKLEQLSKLTSTINFLLQQIIKLIKYT